MAGSDSQPKKATPPRPAINAPRKPLQVMHISRKTEEEITNKESSEKNIINQSKDKRFDEKVLEEEIINSYESKFQKDTEEDSKKIKFYRLKRTPLEILNRSFFFFFIGSFLFSLFLAYSESKLWFILYVISALSCVFYTPNRKALKELIAAWPNIEDLIKGRSLWRKGK